MSNTFKAVLVQAGLVVLQCFVYFGTQFIEGAPHLLGSQLDKAIPFVPVFIYPYVFWYLMLATIALVFYFFSPAAFARFSIAVTIAILAAGITFLIYPTTLERVEVLPGGSFTNRLIHLIYSGDYRCVNCLPSLHCTMAFLFMMGAVSCEGMPWPLKGGICAVSLLIAAATLLVKQHVVADVAAALIYAAAAWAIAGRIGAERLLTLLKMT